MRLSPSLINDVPLVPVVYARILTRLASQLGMNTSRLLSESGIHDALMSDPEGHVSINQLLALFRVAEQTARSPASVPATACSWICPPMVCWPTR